MKDKTIFIITRYSVITGGVKIAAGLSHDEIKRKVFDDDRMKARFAIFSQITAESLMAQKPCNANLHFVILTAEELPSTHRQHLDAKMREIESRSEFKCAVVPIPAGGAIRKHIDNYIDTQLAGTTDHAFATVRMDDDDGLAASYCSRLCAYLERGVLGFPISFAYGYEGFFDHVLGEFSNIRHWYYPKIALGLAFTNRHSNGEYLDKAKSVYTLGSHTRIDAERPIVIDSVEPAYFRTVSKHSDSGGYKYHDQLPEAQQGDINPDEFAFIRAELPQKSRGDEALIVPQAASSPSAKFRAEVTLLRQKLAAR